jgi:NAD(P)-dependent dehydrogenase (short-subunit alcohol dehydrogenase family)
MDKMQGKVALITGAARGQGRAHAVCLAREGADVIAVDICEPIKGVHYPLATDEDLAETVRLVEETGRRCLSYRADARDAARMREVTDEAVARAGTARLCHHQPRDRPAPRHRFGFSGNLGHRH